MTAQCSHPPGRWVRWGGPGPAGAREEAPPWARIGPQPHAARQQECHCCRFSLPREPGDGPCGPPDVQQCTHCWAWHCSQCTRLLVVGWLCWRCSDANPRTAWDRLTLEQRQEPRLLEANLRLFEDLKAVDVGFFSQAPPLAGPEEPNTTLVTVSIGGRTVGARWKRMTGKDLPQDIAVAP